MKLLFLTLLLYAVPFLAKASSDCIWTSHSAGITIRYVAACDWENQATADSILGIVVERLNRKDTGLKVLVLVNHSQLSFPGARYGSFFSIGFDTLRIIDSDAVFNHYWHQTFLSTSKNGGRNTFDSKDAPLDINATKSTKATNRTGIKIIYDRDYRLGRPAWNELVKAIVFAATNPGFIKKEQHRDTVRFNTNGWYVSLTTMDTFAINRIIRKKGETLQAQVAQARQSGNRSYWLGSVLSLTALTGALFYTNRKKAASMASSKSRD